MAEAAIREAAKTCENPAVSFSFGKDSLVCVDIARRIKPDILIVNIDRGQGGDLDEAVEMYDRVAKEQGWNYHRVKTPREIFEIYREVGNLCNLKPGTNTKNLIAGAKLARKQLGVDCDISGLRIEESRGRSHLRRFGPFHYAKTDEVWKCKPVLYWSGADVWAYIVSRELPYLRWYDLEAPFVGYEQARYSNWAGLYLANEGRIVRLKHNYPREYEMLAREFPEIAAYT